MIGDIGVSIKDLTVDNLKEYIDGNGQKKETIILINNTAVPRSALDSFLVNKVKSSFDSNIDKYIDRIKKLLLDSGLNKDPKFFTQVLRNKYNNLDNFIREYVLQEVILKNSLNKVTRISRDYAKNYEDSSKRYGSLTTPGDKLMLKGFSAQYNDYGMSTTFTEAVMLDIPNLFSDPTIITSLTEGLVAGGVSLEEAVKIAEQYLPGQSNKTDAQGFVSVHAWRNLMQGMGEWGPITGQYEQAYQNYLKTGAWGFWTQTTSGKDIFVKPSIKPIKPYYETQAFSEAGLEPVMMKNSLIPLLKNLTIKSPGLEELRLRMEGKQMSAEDKASEVGAKYKNLDSIDIINTDSTHKLSLKNPFKLYDEDNIVINDLSNINVETYDSKGFRIPQKIPGRKAKNPIWSTQYRKNAIANVIEDEIYRSSVNPNIGQITGQELKKLYHGATKELINKTLNLVSKRLGITYLEETKRGGTQEERNRAKLIHLQKVRLEILNQIDDKNLTSNFEDVLDIIPDEKEGWRFKLPLSFPIYQHEFQSILFAIYRNESQKQRLNGAFGVQVADVGGVLVGDNLKFISYDRDTKTVNPAEIIVSRDIAEKFGLKTGDLTDVDAALLRGIGVRIPNQGKNSSLPVIIKDIIDGYESTIIVPGEITTQMGSDFDIDKLFLLLRNFKIDENGDTVPADINVDYKELLDSTNLDENLGDK